MKTNKLFALLIVALSWCVAAHAASTSVAQTANCVEEGWPPIGASLQ